MRPCTDSGAATPFAEAVTAARWRRLAKHRSASQGLQEGHDEEVMLLVDRALRSPVLKGTLGIIQPDSIYTHSRARLRWGFDAGCPLCGAPFGIWQHYIDDCAGTQRPADTHIGAAALRYSGKVPKRWVEPAITLEMQSGYADAHREWDRDAPARYVGADGSCHNSTGGNRAGWGVYWGSQGTKCARGFAGS